MNQILLGAAVGFLGAALLFFTKISNVINSRLSWLIALTCVFLYAMILIDATSLWKLYLATLINGFATYFFFIFYNAAYFEHTPKEKTGHGSAIMFSIGPIVSVAAPLLAGLFADRSYFAVWALVVLFFSIAVFFVRYQPDFKISYTLSESLEEIRLTRAFIFIQGIWEAMIFGIIPVYTLFFIQSPLGYSTYIAYLSLVSVAANMALGKYTDRVQKRIIFLYPITLAMSLVTFSFSLVSLNIFWWVIITGVLRLIMPLFWNVSTAMVVDAHPNLRLAMSGREGVLAIGRTIGIMLSFFMFQWEEKPFIIFILLGTVMLFYSVLLLWRMKLSGQYSYL